MDNLEQRKKLYMKKAAARAELQTMNIDKEGYNKHNKYSYFSEAQYKDIITELLLNHNMELTGSVISAESIQGTSSMPVGARVVVGFTLIDLETGYCESVNSAGDGIDNGDKAIYKAMTGAFKYFMANNFHITTGDDAEKDNKAAKEPKHHDTQSVSDYQKTTQPPTNHKTESEKFRRVHAIAYIMKGTDVHNCLDKMLKFYNVKKIDDMTDEQLKDARVFIDKKG